MIQYGADGLCRLCGMRKKEHVEGNGSCVNFPKAESLARLRERVGQAENFLKIDAAFKAVTEKP